MKKIKSLAAGIAVPLTVLSLALPFLTLSGCASIPAFRDSSAPRLLAAGGTDTDYPYYLYVPAGGMNRNAESRPLLVFLHGTGEGGTDLNPGVMYNGPLQPVYFSEIDSGPVPDDALALMNAHVGESYVLVPQALGVESWDVDRVDALVTAVMERYPIDPKRVYLTGLSMGGFGVWEYAARHPGKFAALVPICGGYEASAPLPLSLSEKPTWAFQSIGDTEVKRSEYQDVIFNYLMGVNLSAPFAEERAFLSATSFPEKPSGTYTLSWSDGTNLGWASGAPEARGTLNYTLYPSRNHDAWTETYENGDMWDWLYSQELR